METPSTNAANDNDARESTLLTPKMLEGLTEFKVGKEQIQVVEPIYQKVCFLLNLDLETQRKGFVVLYKILSMNVTALADAFVQDQLERIKQAERTQATQQQGNGLDAASSSVYASGSTDLHVRKYRKRNRAWSFASAVSSAALKNTLFVDGVTNISIPPTQMEGLRSHEGKSGSSLHQDAMKVTFTSDDPNIRMLKYESLMWTACALFISNSQDENTELQWNGMKISQLLAGCRLRIMAFFDNMALIQNHPKKHILNLSPTFNESMQQLKSVVLTNTLLFKKFNQLWLVRDAIGAENIVSKRGKKAVETHLIHFSWTLFLLIKTRMNGTEPNLVDNYHLLIACVVLTIEGHSAHQARALAERREKQSGTTAPSPILKNEKAEVKQKEAQVI